ncbi:MAG: tRNA (adenosine(37)-N6)-threonylcarbamoyltransferase complex dimerization subunit type 1 TsaB [Jannaschia sp.]
MIGPVLGFDTSGPHCAMAIVADGTVLARAFEPMTKGQAERLMPLIAGLLAEAGLKTADLSAVGVGTGPGNFTGTRIAVAAGRGLALGLGIPAEGVSAIDAYADGRAGVIVCLPAPRGDIILGRGTALHVHRAGDPLPTDWHGDLTGPSADALSAETGRSVQSAPDIAVSIALIAARRAGAGRPRPAPVYLRAADAAPASDLPPVIL